MGAGRPPCSTVSGSQTHAGSSTNTVTGYTLKDGTKASNYAIETAAGTLTVSIVFFVDPPWLKAALAVLGVALGVYMYRLPSRK